MDYTVRPVMNESKIPGMSNGITVNGKHTFFNYGVASKETNLEPTDNTLYELGSISKVFTVILASLSFIFSILNLLYIISVVIMRETQGNVN